MTRDGFLPVYKPLGLTSQQTVLQVKKVCGGKKAGHTGTLDPAAEGLLLVAIGKATRLSEYFLSGEKGYRAQIFFGSSTDTGDREGKVIAQVDEFVLQPKEIEKVLSQFQGSILQVPPGASAVKIKGKRAYTLFRQGLNPELPARQVTIYSICSPEPLAVITPAQPYLTLDILCSKGTYIRSLAADIGEALGCPAHLSALVRTSIGQITLTQAASLAELRNGYQPWLLDMAVAVSSLPKLELSAPAATMFIQGQTLHAVCPDGEVAVFSDQRLLGIAKALAGKIKPVKVLV